MSARPHLRDDEVLGYVINAYAGTEPSPTNPHILRRVYLWETAGDVMMGNTEAFARHLKRRFPGLRVDPSEVHALLRALGEQVAPQGSRRPATGPGGKFRQPAPEEWVVARGAKKPRR